MRDLVAIGASWGGLHAIGTVLGSVPADLPAAIVVAQHRGSDHDLLAPLLDKVSRLPVRDADDKDPLEPGTVLVAPRQYHLLVEGDSVALSTDEPVAFSRPSIDVLFETAASARGERVIGVILSGANADGAAGLAAIRRRGGVAIVQDPGTAERPEMPQAALAACPDARVRRLEEIGPELGRICVGAAR
ncbi:MAG TPA: chemotaxis protein CheB [Capillimicrobium sp.]|nr:chemotaxis protein CheB [Capillimicrobium sp.]